MLSITQSLQTRAPSSSTQNVERHRFPPIGVISSWLREAVATVVWGFILVKCVVYDLDIYLVTTYAPRLRPILDFRFFILLSTIATLWMVLGHQRFRAFVAYVVFYPVVVLAWKLPKLFVSNWAVAVAFFPAIYSLVTTFRRSFVFATVTVLSGLAIAVSSFRPLIIAAMFILAAYLLVHFVDRFRVAFRPSRVFADIGTLVHSLWTRTKSIFLDDVLRKISETSPNADEYEVRRLEAVFHFYICTHVLQFFAEKLRAVAASRKLDIYLIIALLYTTALTVIIFGAEYWALSKISPESFQPEGIGFWAFLGYSFETLMTADVSGIQAISGLAQAICYAELVAAGLIFVIFVFVILTIVRERYKEEMDVIVTELGEIADRLRFEMKSHFGMSLAEAEGYLIRSRYVQQLNAFRQLRGMPKLGPEDIAT